jgi:tetratricopeptide (TPR) repeat protein
MLAPQFRRFAPAISDSGSHEPEAERFRLYEAVSDFLVSLASTKPVFLFLDDLHWSDAATILMLEHVARRIQDARVFLGATYRDTDIEDHHALAALLREVTRRRLGRVLTLEPLGRDDCAALLQSLAHAAPSAEVVEALHEETRGNALFLVETARSMVELGRDLTSADVSQARNEVPETVRGVIGERLTRLSPATKEVLDQAAILGGNLSTPVIAAATGERERDLLRQLEEAHKASILDEVGIDFVFAHPIIQQTIYQELSAPRRSLLHRQAGEAIERLFGPHPDRVAELAYHYCEGGDRTRGQRYSRLAGERAKELLAYEEASKHFERALDLTDDGDDLTRYELLAAMGGMLWMQGDFSRATDAKEQAIAIARRMDAPELLAQAVLDLRQGFTQLQLGADEPYVALIEEALDRLGPTDSALRAKLLARLAARYYFSPEEKRRLSLSADAVEIARRVGDPSTLATALIVRHSALREPHHLGERIAAASEIVELADHAGIPAIALSGYSAQVEDFLEMGDRKAADEAMRLHRELTETLRHYSAMVHAAQFQAMCATIDGHLDDAERLAQEALSLGQRVQSRTAVAIFGTQLFIIRKDQGRLEEIEDGHRALAERYPTIPAYRCALAALYTELGNPTEARTQFEELILADEINLPRDGNWLIGLAFLSETCAYLQDEARATHLYERLLPFREHVLVAGYGTLYLGPAARYLGLLAKTRSDDAAAVGHYEEALKVSDRIGSPSSAARSEYEFATMLLERGSPEDKPRACELLADAQTRAMELGMRRLEEGACQLSKKYLGGQPGSQLRDANLRR